MSRFVFSLSDGIDGSDTPLLSPLFSHPFSLTPPFFFWMSSISVQFLSRLKTIE